MDRRSLGIWKYALIGWGGALVLMFGSQMTFGRMGPADFGTARVLIPTAATTAAVAWAYAMAALAFRHLDEFQVAASKFAWYWGGTIGLSVSVIGYTFIALGGLHWLDPAHFHLGAELYRSFQIGYLLGVAGPFLGFLAARLWWSMAKR
jgi:hypothetical protein